MNGVWEPSRCPPAVAVRAAYPPALRSAFDRLFPELSELQRHLVTAGARGASFLAVGPLGSGRLSAAAAAAAAASHAGRQVTLVSADNSRRARFASTYASLGGDGSRLVTTDSFETATAAGLLMLDVIDPRLIRISRLTGAEQLLLLAQPFGGQRSVAGEIATMYERCGLFDGTPYSTLRARTFSPLRNDPWPADVATGAAVEAEVARAAGDWRQTLSVAARSGCPSGFRETSPLAIGLGDGTRWCVAECAEPRQPLSPSLVGEVLALDPIGSVTLWARMVAATGDPDKELCAGAIVARDGRQSVAAHIVSRSVRRGALETSAASTVRDVAKAGYRVLAAPAVAPLSADIAAELFSFEEELCARIETGAERAAWWTVASLFANSGNARAIVAMYREQRATGGLLVDGPLVESFTVDGVGHVYVPMLGGSSLNREVGERIAAACTAASGCADEFGLLLRAADPEATAFEVRRLIESTRADSEHWANFGPRADRTLRHIARSTPSPFAAAMLRQASRTVTSA